MNEINNILPVARETASQTLYVTTTGFEKALTIIGGSTIAILALIGLITIIVKFVKASIKPRIKKINLQK